MRLPIGAIAALLLTCSSVPAAHADWIADSNRYAQILLDIQARYSAESASSLGVDGHDADVVDLNPGLAERQISDLRSAEAQLKAAQSTATDSRVRQDLDILTVAAADQRHSLELNERLMLPYFDLPQLIFGGFRQLMRDDVPQARQVQALVRLRRYVGREKGYTPIAVLARARIEEKLGQSGLTAPWAPQVAQALDNQKRYMDGIQALFKKSGMTGWQGDLQTLNKQIYAYGNWLQTAVLPVARKTNLLPPQIYADNLKTVGVDADPRQLIEQALAAYVQTRDELTAVSLQVAQHHGWASGRYPDVIRELKKARIPKDQLLRVYQDRLSRMEAVIGEQNLVTLPKRSAVIRLASEAESAAVAAPHLDIPRLIGNTGQSSDFVIPVSNPNSRSGTEMDDFNYDAVTWTLTAHEARPGHELQFSRMLEHGVSTARALFAFNSVNVEGWALYAEAIMKNYEPPEAQVATLQLRLMRAARAFLDPMINLGLMQPDAAKRVLMDGVCLSEPMAKQEIDRYTFDAPGQATAYFYGYQKLEALRARTEIALAGKFNVKSYHDFIVNQGLLPLRLLDTVVAEEYVPSQK